MGFEQLSRIAAITGVALIASAQSAPVGETTPEVCEGLQFGSGVLFVVGSSLVSISAVLGLINTIIGTRHAQQERAKEAQRDKLDLRPFKNRFNIAETSSLGSVNWQS